MIVGCTCWLAGWKAVSRSSAPLRDFVDEIARQLQHVKRPSSDFVKAYGHNGYFKSLKAIVHFYNTRDALPRCQPDDPGEGRTCWPTPESIANMNTKRMGRLGLSETEEDAIVSFLQTMTDGFMPVNRQ